MKPMRLVDLRLPDEAIALIDLLKDRFPHHAGKPSRTSVIIHTLLLCVPADRNEMELQDQLRLWIDQRGTGT